MYTLETERLIIRRFRDEDWQDLYEYLSRETVVRYEPYEVYSREGCKVEANERAQSDAYWAVCLKENGKLIGHVYFRRQEPVEFSNWEIGFVFNPAYWGRGYATEACRRVMEHGFADLGARRVVALCNPQNTAAWRLLERLHMRREGHLRRNQFFKRDTRGNPIWVDTYAYAILSEEWPLHNG